MFLNKILFKIVSFSSNRELISGDSEGNILVWNVKESKIDKIIKQAHDGTVFSILSTEQGKSNFFLFIF